MAANIQAAHQERNPKSLESLVGLLLFGLPPFVVAFIGSQWTSPNVDSDWYRELARPSWQPPSWVFAPVWTSLYLTIGIAAWRIWLTRSESGGQLLPLGLWVVQLSLNLGWTFAFFEQRSPVSGLTVIVALWLAIVATMAAFALKSKLAAVLLVPYVGWVTFAATLNFAIWRMN